MRDVQLGGDAHRYANRIGAPPFSFLRTVILNLLLRAGFRSIHEGQQGLAHDISRMLALPGVITAVSPAWSDFEVALLQAWYYFMKPRAKPNEYRLDLVNFYSLEKWFILMLTRRL